MHKQDKIKNNVYNKHTFIYIDVHYHIRYAISDIIYNNGRKVKYTIWIHFIKLNYTIQVYISDNEYRFSIWLLYTKWVYVYWYDILYHDIMLSLYLTIVYYKCIHWRADALYYTISLHIKHILYQYTLNERILYEYIINIYEMSTHWREEGSEWILIQDDE